MFPKLITIGDFFLPSYGFLLSAAFLIALVLAHRLARRAGLDPESILNLAIYCALSGIAGAKLMMFLTDASYYLANPGEIFSLTTLRAGGIFYGGLLAALGVAIYYMRRQHLPLLKTADVLAPALAFGHALGRVGCFAAGCCWGTECSRPWAVTFRNEEAHRLFGTPLNRPLHPTQLYEMAAELINFAILWHFFRKPHRDGAVVGLYLLLYSTERFVIEFFRDHEQANPFGGPLSAAQWTSIGLVTLVAIWTWRVRTRAVRIA